MENNPTPVAAPHPDPGHTNQGSYAQKVNSAVKSNVASRDTYRRSETTKNSTQPWTAKNGTGSSSENPKIRENRANESKETPPPNSNVTIDNSFYLQSEARKEKYRTRKCLIIHDPYFDQFDKSKFSKWYDIETMRFDTLHSASSDRSLATKISKINPEVIFLHLGQADLLNKTAGSELLEKMKTLVRSLLKNTKSKICVSLVIPLPGFPQLTDTISQVNKETSNFVSDLRQTSDGEPRIYTQNNNALGGYITRSVGSHGVVVSLDTRGQRKLWLSLRDGLNRTLRVMSKQPKNNGHIIKSQRNSPKNG